MVKKDVKELKALEFLKNILERMAIKASVELKREPNYSLLEIKGENLNVLIGTEGKTLEAIQKLVNLVANKGSTEWHKFIVDAAGYRERRKQNLVEYAKRVAERVISENTPVPLEPMSSYERRIIHLALSENPQVETRSEGEEPLRRVVIFPKSQNKLLN